MSDRNLRIVKLTPIALALCDSCNMEFHSFQRVEDDAEREMEALFESHQCRNNQAVVARAAPAKKAATDS